MSDKNSFEYTYTASQREEVSKIRDKYVEGERAEKTDLERLVALDRAVTRRASVAAITLGTVGVLILGLGMSLVMTQFASDIFSGWGVDRNIVGIVVGIFGMILSAAAYPMYRRTLARERKRVAPEIIELSDRLMK